MKKAPKVRLSEAALKALPVATGDALLSDYAGHVWRRWDSPTEKVIADPAAYLTGYAMITDHRFAVAPPDVDGARLVYELSDDEAIPPGYSPDMRFLPAFFIISRDDDAKREAAFEKGAC